MKKHSKFFTRNEATIKSLLQQLTLREIESQEVKINQLITRHKQNKESMRSLKTSQQEAEGPKGRAGRALRKETSRKPASTQDLDKENQLVPLLKKVSVNVKSCEDESEVGVTNRENKGRGIRKTGKIHTLSSHLPILPEIPRHSKRNSIEVNNSCCDSACLHLNSQSANTTKLAIIQQMEQLSKISQTECQRKHCILPVTKQRSIAMPRAKLY